MSVGKSGWYRAILTFELARKASGYRSPVTQTSHLNVRFDRFG